MAYLGWYPTPLQHALLRVASTPLLRHPGEKPVLEDGTLKALDEGLGGMLTELMELNEFKAKAVCSRREQCCCLPCKAVCYSICIPGYWVVTYHLTWSSVGRLLLWP